MLKHTEIIKYADTNISNNTQVLKAEFYIDEGKRTVFCKLRDDVLFFDSAYSGTKHTYIQDYIKNGFFEGKAKCCPEDNFDIKTGKNVAFYKSIYKRSIIINLLLKERENNYRKQLNIPVSHMINKINK